MAKALHISKLQHLCSHPFGSTRGRTGWDMDGTGGSESYAEAKAQSRDWLWQQAWHPYNHGKSFKLAIGTHASVTNVVERNTTDL
jgi:hypothetical protein